MASQDSSTKNTRLDQIVADARRSQERRQVTYRDRALKLYPHICARCGREYAGKDLQNLTVHHKDHDHDNNPLDGSNWELLCGYCHDKEHGRYVDQHPDDHIPLETGNSEPLNRPFAALEALLKGKK